MQVSRSQSSHRHAQSFNTSNIYREVLSPSLKKIMFFDLLIFAIVFFSVFFASLSSRSMAFNVTVSFVLLLKVVAGMCYFKRASHRALRLYFILRLSVDTFVYLPLFYIFRALTAAYTINYFLGLGLLFLSELVLILIYRRDLFSKTLIESLEEI